MADPEVSAKFKLVNIMPRGPLGPSQPIPPPLNRIPPITFRLMSNAIVTNGSQAFSRALPPSGKIPPFPAPMTHPVPSPYSGKPDRSLETERQWSLTPLEFRPVITPCGLTNPHGNPQLPQVFYFSH